MNVYLCTDHTGRISPGACAVVVANDKAEAVSLLTLEIISHGGNVPDDAFNLRLIGQDRPHAIVFRNGEMG